MNAFSAWLASIIAPIVAQAVTEAVKAAFAEMKDKAEVSKPNESLQNSWSSNSNASD